MADELEMLRARVAALEAENAKLVVAARIGPLGDHHPAAAITDVRGCLGALVAVGPGKGFALTTSATTSGDTTIELLYRFDRHGSAKQLATLTVRLGTATVCRLQVPSVPEGGGAEAEATHLTLLEVIVGAAIQNAREPEPEPAAVVALAPEVWPLTETLNTAAAGLRDQLLVGRSAVEEGPGGSGGGAVMFAQLQVYQQEHPNCCGYHSMHNGALVLAALRQPRPDLASLAVALQDNVSFWRDLLRIQALLRTAEAARQPAGRRRCAALEEIESVVIERSMLALVPSAFEAAFGSAAVADRVTPVADWGGDWGSQWAPLEGALEAVVGAAPGYAHVLLLGSHKHWVCLVVHKLGAESYEMLLCDSGNKPVGPHTSEAQLLAVAEARHTCSAAVGRAVERLRRLARFQGMSDAELEAVHTEGVPLRFDTHRSAEAPKHYWRFKPAQFNVEEDMVELRLTQRYLRCVAAVLSGSATSLRELYLEHLVERWVAEFEAQTLVEGPNGTLLLSAPRIAVDDGREWAGVEAYSQHAQHVRAGAAWLARGYPECWDPTPLWRGAPANRGVGGERARCCEAGGGRGAGAGCDGVTTHRVRWKDAVDLQAARGAGSAGRDARLPSE